MIESSISNVMDEFNTRSQDALGYNVPGYQPHFHDVLNRTVKSIKIFDPLSVTAPQDTYFVVDNGDGSHSYTRSGNFRVSQGQLVTSDGRAVLGYPNGVEKGTLAPIMVPPGVPDGKVSIAEDGTVSYGGGDKGIPKGMAGASMVGAAAPVIHAPPVTSASASVNLPAPTNAVTPATAPPVALRPDDAKSLDVPDIAVGADADVPAALPQSLPQTMSQTATATPSPSRRHHHRAAPQAAAVTAPTTATDAAANASMMAGLKNSALGKAAEIGTPLGKIALARFETGTTISNDGRSTSGPPIEMGPPGNGTIAKLKTRRRDVGSVDPIAARLQVSQASSVMNAMLQIETARQSNAKKVMDLIK